MTDTYTIEQFSAAWAKTCNPCDWRDMDDRALKRLITELQRPAWKPAVGEVYSYSKGQEFLVHADNRPTSKTARPQTLTEHGPAVKALRDAACAVINHGNNLDDIYDLETALKAFDEVVK